MIFFSMLILGALIGFVGAGGAGVVITLLTVGFGVPIHTALGVALASMLFTMLSGAVSHFREGEVVVKTGAVLGAGGVLGALLGAEVSNVMPSEELGFLTALMLLLSAFTLYMKVYRADLLDRIFHVRGELLAGKKLIVYGLSLGFVNGFLSGAFGIGAAAFIQLTLLCVFGVPLLQSIGTCMMVILPISAAGGLGYMMNGRLDLDIFIQTLFGLMAGAFVGAKCTHLAPRPLLKAAIVGMPTIGGFIMLFFR